MKNKTVVLSISDVLHFENKLARCRSEEAKQKYIDILSQVKVNPIVSAPTGGMPWV